MSLSKRLERFGVSHSLDSERPLLRQDASETGAAAKIPLTRLLRRSFIRAALIPLLAVEVVLVIAFLVTHQVSTASQIAVQRVDAQENLVRLVQARADALTQELESVAIGTDLYRRQAEAALRTPAQATHKERSRYAKTPDGAFATQRDTGGAAAFYSNLTPVGAAQRQKIWRTARLDPFMKDLVEVHPLITQVYFNSFDSYNRIYPYFDAAKQYPPNLNIPTYNFYYLADATHNPMRSVVWTDSYLDPAGQGWMVSCIAPVYQGDFLEGVVGSDITLEVLINQVLVNQVPWNGYALLLAKDGTILALPQAAEREWGLTEKTNHSYTDFIREDTFKPEEFNLFRRPDLAAFGEAIQQQFTSVQNLTLGGQSKLAAWSHIPDTGWTYLVIVPEQEVFARTQVLGQRLLFLGKVMILGMIVFYTLFLVYLLHSGNRMSRQVAEPLQEIETLVNAIAAGQYTQAAPTMAIAELDHTATQVVAMGKTLGDRTEALMKALKVKADFLGIVSHELRTPMNGILGMGELLRLTPLDATQRDYLETIMLSGEHLLRLLNDILDMSRLEAHALTLNPVSFDLEEFLQEKAALWRSRIEQKGLAFDWEMAADLPHQVIADRERLRQMLNNFLSNALKFTPEGRIQLQVSRASLDVPTSGSPANATTPTQAQSMVGCRFAISDTGIGIAIKDQVNLFRPFSQVDNSLQRAYEGAGLGLSIVKELAELMGGRVGVESRLGRGTTFWFEIPLRVAEEAAIAGTPTKPPLPTAARLPARASEPVAATTPPKARILIVEDNRVNQKFALLVVHQLGADCDIAADGQEAIDLFAQATYDLVLMDLHMPRVDGITALHAIRQINPQAVVVAVTADALPETCDRLRQAGFNAYITKPFRLKDMREVILNALPTALQQR